MEWLQLAAMCSCNVQVQPDCWLQYEQFEGKGTLAAFGDGTVGFSPPAGPCTCTAQVRARPAGKSWLPPIPMNLFIAMSLFRILVAVFLPFFTAGCDTLCPFVSFFSVKGCQRQGLGQDLQATTIENSKLKCSSTFTAMCQNGDELSLYTVHMLECNLPLQPIHVCLTLYSSSCLGGRLYSMYVYVRIEIV